MTCTQQMGYFLELLKVMLRVLIFYQYQRLLVLILGNAQQILVFKRQQQHAVTNHISTLHMLELMLKVRMVYNNTTNNFIFYTNATLAGQLDTTAMYANGHKALSDISRKPNIQNVN